MRVPGFRINDPGMRHYLRMAVPVGRHQEAD